MSRAAGICAALLVLLGLGMSFARADDPAPLAPPNDQFTNRQALSGSQVSIRGSTVGASAESGESLLADAPMGQTVWWTWTAPSNGCVLITNFSSRFSPTVGIYTGTELTNLALVASNTSRWCWDNGIIEGFARNVMIFHAQAGETYQIAADGFLFNGPEGEVNLGMVLIPTPANDNFTNATLLTGSVFTVASSNYGASSEPGEPSIDGNPGGSSIWYSWTAPSSGTVVISSNMPVVFQPPTVTNIPSYLDRVGTATNGTVVQPPTNFDYGDTSHWFYYGCAMSDSWNEFALTPAGMGSDLNPPPVFYPLFAVYTGTAVNDLTPVASGSEMQFKVVAGTTYSIAMDGNQGTVGEMGFNMVFTPAPPNDQFTNAIPLFGGHMLFTGYIFGAETESGEPACLADGGHSVWWTWTSPAAGRVHINASGDQFNPTVEVFTGNYLTNLTALTNAQSAPLTGQFEFQAIEHGVYCIRVDGVNGTNGAVNLELELTTATPQLAGLRWLPSTNGNRMVFQTLGFKDKPSRIQYSTDLVHWADIHTWTAGELDAFEVSVPPDARPGFFRVIAE